MSLSNDQITAQNFKDFYEAIRPYLGGAHGGFTPIGTVIAVMGNSAPANYLACDGTVYNIADYPELARYFYQQFEAINFFGGDGTTTFAVPDLRGEFLRGTGTNSHTDQGNGENVGTHQDATEIPYTTAASSGGFVIRTVANTAISPAKIDKTIGSSPTYSSFTKDSSGSNSSFQRYTTRPTNTSVLYCIAVKNIFMDAGSNYSTDEQVVGTWIDGKPLYQKTITGTLTSSITDTVISVSTLNIDKCWFDKAFVKWVDNNDYGYIDLNVCNQDGYMCNCFYQYSNQSIIITRKLPVASIFNSQPYYITIQYTKTS